jgi:hypothetical protein
MFHVGDAKIYTCKIIYRFDPLIRSVAESSIFLKTSSPMWGGGGEVKPQKTGEKIILFVTNGLCREY